MDKVLCYAKIANSDCEYRTIITDYTDDKKPIYDNATTNGIPAYNVNTSENYNICNSALYVGRFPSSSTTYTYRIEGCLFSNAEFTIKVQWKYPGYSEWDDLSTYNYNKLNNNFYTFTNNIIEFDDTGVGEYVLKIGPVMPYNSTNDFSEVTSELDIPIFYDYSEYEEYVLSQVIPPPGPQGDATCKVNYYLQDGDYTYSKITFKEDTPPIDMNDGYVEDIDASQSSINIENLVEGQKYYFTIFTDKSESEPFPYIVGPVITDWVNAELPSPMLCDETTKPYKYETQTEMSSMIEKDIKALGYKLTVSKNLYNNLIPTGSSARAFWIFGNNQRGLYVYYQNVSGQACIFMKAYYKNSVLFDEQLEVRVSAISARNGYMYFGKNDITKKGSTVFISMSRAGTSGTIRPFVINDTTMYYFITNRPNPDDYTWYIDQINGTGFSWKDLERNSGSGYNKYPFSDYSQWRSDNGDTGSFIITNNENAYVFQTEKSRIDIVSTDYVTYSAILNPVNPFEDEYYDSFDTYGYYTVGRCRWNGRRPNRQVIQGMTNEVNGYPYTATGTLEEVFDAIRMRCRNVSIYVNGDCWSEV